MTGHVRAAGTALLTLMLVLAAAGRAGAQGTTGPVVTDSKVGYIDNAIPGDVFRLRVDAASRFMQPARAEFFYAAGAPFGPGLPRPERSIDYQELSLYAEHLVTPRLSVFADLPVRFLQPEVNDHYAGLSDVSAGGKYAFVLRPQTAASLQLTTFAPSGNPGNGLGTGHVSLDSALLLYHGLSERLALSGEFHVWVPVGGTAFAGDVLRYGVGAQYDVYRGATARVTPVLEFVGFSVLSGKEPMALPAGGAVPRGAAGDTIVNAKFGARVGVGDRLDFYAGYGRALSGTRWYQDIVRVEMRLRY